MPKTAYVHLQILLQSSDLIMFQAKSSSSVSAFNFLSLHFQEPLSKLPSVSCPETKPICLKSLDDLAFWQFLVSVLKSGALGRGGGGGGHVLTLHQKVDLIIFLVTVHLIKPLS